VFKKEIYETGILAAALVSFFMRNLHWTRQPHAARRAHADDEDAGSVEHERQSRKD